MLGSHRLVVDEWAEVWDLLKPHADASFWQWSDVKFDPQSYYIIGRLELHKNWQSIRDLAEQYPGRIIFCNPAEGSETVLLQIRRLRIRDLVESGKLGLITSGDLEPGINYIKTDCYFSNIVTYLENIAAHNRAAEVQTANKAYDFLFLNGRLRPHRKYLIDGLRSAGLLDRALWTNLNQTVAMPWTSKLIVNNSEPIRFLPKRYEIERAIPNQESAAQQDFAKHTLFGNTWGDAIVNADSYIDTCFSLVTETIFDYPYTFRTEKIWKPIIMEHPFVVAANRGFYRDLHAAGFRTFGHLIDESFDTLDDPTERAEKIVAVVRDICYNGAMSFLAAAADVCKYNFLHLQEHNQHERRELVTKLEQYLNARS